MTHGSKHLATRLQSVSTALRVDGGLYLGGYQIDAAGVNNPYIVFVPSSLNGERYWPQPESVQEFFEWQGHVHVLHVSGAAFENQDAEWIASPLRFSPGSVVIDSGTELIACNPAPLLMTSDQRGACYSPTGRWSVDVNWREVRPQRCGGTLTVIESRQGAVIARQLRSSDGQELAVMPLTQVITDPCSIRFNSAAR